MNPRFVALGPLVVAALLLVAPAALAQSWAGSRSTPSLTELFAVDTTGENGWLYGQEDLAGDGSSFQVPEQSIDIRTAYASTDAQDFWVRSYVSATQAPGADVSLYVFIDADAQSGTGGPAVAANIDPDFTADPSAGGYEWVVGLRGDESVVGLWEWDGTAWTTASFTPQQIAAEAAVDLDPIRIGANDHGYIQGRIELALVGLTEPCNANLYVRSSNEAGAGGPGDLEVGQVGGCVPADANNDDIPDPLEPNGGCTSDDQCPGDGVCVNGACVIAAPCVDDTDCAANHQCTPDGRCVPVPSGTCTTNDECTELVCSGGQCVACTLGGSECGAGRRCAPNGRCVADTPGAGGSAGSTGIEPAEGQEVQGGACVCTAASGSSPGALALLLVPLALALRRLRRRAPR
jgi:hypothetical protein